jgi:NADPH-dependent 2,4-dienoyl-CoA reductase/sulfur reductase-like enzyme/ferredoxin
MSTSFPTYLDLPRRVPRWAWRAVRVAAVVVYVALIVMAVRDERTTLALWWGVVVPVLPLVLLLAPGVWRNVCPLSSLNQASRVLGLSRRRPLPPWLARHAQLIGIMVFLAAVVARKVWLNTSGIGTAAMLGTVAVAATVGGFVFDGKSGWCSSVCPMLAVERLYGQSPVATVANAHCSTCVGCTTNCYDFNPRGAYLADVHGTDVRRRSIRRLFAGVFPGLVQGYFVVPDAAMIGLAPMLGRMALWMAVSLAVFTALDAVVEPEHNRLPSLAAAVAITIFYAHGVHRVVGALHLLVGGDWHALVWPVRGVVALVAGWWWARARRLEDAYVDEQATTAVPVQLAAVPRRSVGQLVEVVVDGEPVSVRRGTTLLDAAEQAGAPVATGCRSGICGADPVHVLEGGDGLSPIRRVEQETLDRLGLEGGHRMACMASVEHRCRISSKPIWPAVQRTAPRFAADPGLRRLVVVGNGAAGVTVADLVRRHNPDVVIDLVSAEPHLPYNRMAIAKALVGRSAMQGLSLRPEGWFEEHRISTWLNTRVVAIDREAKVVQLGLGGELAYDKLVLATGGRSTVPAVEGFGIPGTYVLRDAADAMALRADLQDGRVHRAVVLGGGPLGLEAAHALHDIGVSTTVVARSGRLLEHHLDPWASELLRTHFETVGVRIALSTDLRAINGNIRVAGVHTSAWEDIDCDVVVAAIGTTPNVELARAAGLTIGRGIRVDTAMRTSDPDIFAIGDTAEVDGRVPGLWSVAVHQATVAANVITGIDDAYRVEAPRLVLKDCGLDVVAFGRGEPAPEEHLVVDAPIGRLRYRKLVVHDGLVVGGLILGDPELAAVVLDLADSGTRLDDGTVAALHRGDWSVLVGRDALAS